MSRCRTSNRVYLIARCPPSTTRNLVGGFRGRGTSIHTVEQTCVEHEASSNEGNQEPSASKYTLSTRNSTASTGGSSLLELVRESLPSLLRIHVMWGLRASAGKGERSGLLFGNCRDLSAVVRTLRLSAHFSPSLPSEFNSGN